MKRLIAYLLLAGSLSACTGQPTISSTFENCRWWYDRGYAEHARCVKTRLVASYSGTQEYEAMLAFSDRYILIGEAMDDGRLSSRKARMVLLEEWLDAQRALSDARRARDARTTQILRSLVGAAVIGL